MVSSGPSAVIVRCGYRLRMMSANLLALFVIVSPYSHYETGQGLIRAECPVFIQAILHGDLYPVRVPLPRPNLAVDFDGSERSIVGDKFAVPGQTLNLLQGQRAYSGHLWRYGFPFRLATN